MDDFIDREAVYRFAQEQKKKETGAYSKGWNHAMDVIKSAVHNKDAIPAADVAPVVRCGECIKPIEECPFKDHVMLKTDFCSYGERRNGDATD